MGPLARLIGHGIGLAREGMAARTAGSNGDEQADEHGDVPQLSEHGPSDQATELDDGSSQEDFREHDYGGSGEYGQMTNVDEAEWYLDDVAEELDTPQSPEPAEARAREADDVAKEYTGIKDTSVSGAKLECPVLLPQRRPRHKSRGFVRAYAPMLADCGIDQETFLKFIKDFHESSKANPVFHVINVAAFAVGIFPSVTAMAVSIAVQTASRAAQEIQSRSRTNSFLDTINDSFFRPRGLYCMLLTYKPLKVRKDEREETSTTIAKTTSPADSELREKMKSLRLTSGKTVGAVEMPEAAPLIFPTLEKAAESEEKRAGLKKGSKFLNGYLDRRAQAQYAHQNPGSQLAVGPEQKFASRYSDPNHPASNGSLISLVTGGHVNPRGHVDKLRQKYRDHRREKLNSEATVEAEARGEDAKEVIPETRVANRTGIIRRLLRENIIYLAIFNMPSDEELAAARESLEAAKAKSQAKSHSLNAESSPNGADRQEFQTSEGHVDMADIVISTTV